MQVLQRMVEVEDLERLGGAGIRPRTVMVARPTLDDVFLLHTGATIEGRENEGDTASASEEAA